MSMIKMTPEELRDAATFLTGKRDEIVTAVTNIKSKVDATTAGWAGAAQSSFIASFEEMLPMLQDTFPQVIEGIAAQLNGAADAIETADTEVANAFKG